MKTSPTLVAWPVQGQEIPVAAEGRTAQPVGAWRVFVSPELPDDPGSVNLSVFHTEGTLVGFPPASPRRIVFYGTVTGKRILIN